MKTKLIPKSIKKEQAGFTLLELLVAMVIFSLMSVMAYGGLSNVITGNEVIAEQEKRLKELQRTMMFLERDMRQIVPRPRSTGFNEFAKAFDYGLDSDGLLEFTRAGNPNPIAQVRSSLQRVRYDLEEKVLIRKSWALVDHINLEPTSMKLLNDVESLELRLLDKNDEWQDNWKQIKEIPQAVEITIDHTNWGKIKRLIPVR
ncbi:MAG: general secretion pathway protein J [Cocleimonas sp.]|jgi:general secretion pathway protein J